MTQSDTVTLYLWHFNGTREYIILKRKSSSVKLAGDTTLYSLNDFYMNPETAHKLQHFTYSHVAKDGALVFTGQEPKRDSRLAKYAVRIVQAILNRKE